MDSSPIAKRLRTDLPIVEQTAEIFNVNIDCMENIFDYLALEDVCAFGMTCKRMQQLAGKYFQQFYPMHRVMIGRNERSDIEESMATENSTYHLNDVSRFGQKRRGQHNECMTGVEEKYPTNFGRFADDLELIGSDIEVLRYAVEIMSQDLKSISLRDFTEYSPTHEECVAKLVQNVECLTLAGACNCNRYKLEVDVPKYGDDSLCYDDILKHCNKLKCLKFACDWNFNIREKYPQIEHLILKHPFSDVSVTSDFDISKLKTFLDQNTHIKKLSVISEQPAVTVLLDLLKKVDLHLDKLSAIYDRIGDADDYDFDVTGEIFFENLSNLYKRGKYKELEMNISVGLFFRPYIDIKNASEITKLEIFFNDTEDTVNFMQSYFDEHGDDTEKELSDDELIKRRAKYIAIPNGLKYLRLKGLIYAIDAEILARKQKEVEYLRLDGELEGGVLDAFASHSSALKEIIFKNDNFNVNEIKLATINNNRGNLENPQKLTIYLPEKHFIQLKWSTTELESKYVEVKRLNEWCMKSPLNEIMQRHGGEHLRYSKYFY